MITFNEIGYYGRLGNQMFQFASTLGIGRKLGYEVFIPIENTIEYRTQRLHNNKEFQTKFELPDVFNLNTSLFKSKSEIVTVDTISEPGFHFSDSMFKIPDNVNLHGYYQSEKYFKHIEFELRNLFEFKDEIKSKALELKPKVDTKIVSIHLRLGDYVYLNAYHPVCSVEYYSNSMEHFMDDDYYFLIFSDEVEKARSIFGTQENILYSENTDPYVDMCLMSMCDHNVIANSSFSWWAAWLNKSKNKKVIAPKQWFGPAYNFHNTADLYCNNWIIT